jgi:uncharacterized protein YndB with AHSA1/START domain
MSVTTNGTAKVTLPADDQILIEREFAAPAALVWRAVTEPDLVRQWWHAGRGEMTACEIDLRVGGKWRYAMRPEGAEEFAFYGEYLDIVEGEKIVSTEVFAPFPDAGSTNTMTLVERDGVTTLTTLVQSASPEARDMQINSGMEAGMQDAFDRLERVAIGLA